MMMRMAGRDLNHIQTALAHRSAILMDSLTDDTELFKTEQINLYGEDVKMVRWHKLNLVLFTPAEKYELVTKYESGISLLSLGASTAVMSQSRCQQPKEVLK